MGEPAHLRPLCTAVRGCPGEKVGLQGFGSMLSEGGLDAGRSHPRLRKCPCQLTAPEWTSSSYSKREQQQVS